MVLEPRRAVTVLAAAAAMLAVAAPSAWGHAAFAGASPAPGARVESSPARIVLRFSEPLERKLTEVSVARVGGDHVGTRQERADRREVVLIPDAPLPRGAYSVRWHSVATGDGHPLEGSYGFGVRVAAAGGQSVEQSPFAGAGWARALARGALYAVLLSFAGALLAGSLVGGGPRRRGGSSWLAPEALGRDEAISHDLIEGVRLRQRRLLGDLGLFATALAAVVAVLDAADAAGSATPGGLRDFLLGGFSGFARIAVVAAAGLAAMLAARRPRAAAVAAAYALGFVAASGHANSASPRALALAVDWVHLLAAAAWLGAAAFLVLAWGPALRESGRAARSAVARHVLPAYGRLALPAFLVVTATGTVSVLIELGSLRAFVESDYGIALLVKIALVGVIAAIAFFQVTRLRADHEGRWRAVRTEPLLGLGVVAAVALLAVFPLPPRQLGQATGALAAIPGCDPCPLPAATADELPVAGESGTRVVAAWIRRREGRLAGTVRALDFRGRRAPGPLHVLGARHEASCGRGCLRFSDARGGPVLRVEGHDGGRRFVTALPASWQQSANASARRLLARAEETMRGLGSVREFERVSSGPGTQAIARYLLQAPDRYAYRTNLGVEQIGIGSRQYLRAPGSPWRVEAAPGGAPFRTRSWFRWTPYAQAVRLLGIHGSGRERVADLALADPATPVWLRLDIELATGRVVRERLVARARFVLHRFSAFNSRVRITAPRTGGG